MYKLYKKDSKGKVRYLKIWAEAHVLMQESGVVGTENPILHTKKIKGKNLGKSNETSDTEQATLEAKRLNTTKLREGYYETIEEAEVSDCVLPMLAKDYEKEAKKIKWGESIVIENPKLDGMRCLAFVKSGGVTLISRKGVVIENLRHIESELSGLPDCILDGELYVHGESFQTNMSYIKKYTKGKTERISLWVYDMVSDEPYNIRLSEAVELISGLTHVKPITFTFIKSELEMLEKFEEHIKDGYEGMMVKIVDGGYKSNTRSSSLLKYKTFMDNQYKIIDVIPSDARPDWGKPVFEGFSAGTKFPVEFKKDLLLNKNDYIGKIAEVRFFGYTDEGLPRFPVMVGIRLDK